MSALALALALRVVALALALALGVVALALALALEVVALLTLLLNSVNNLPRLFKLLELLN